MHQSGSGHVDSHGASAGLGRTAAASQRSSAPSSVLLLCPGRGRIYLIKTTFVTKISMWRLSARASLWRTADGPGVSVFRRSSAAASSKSRLARPFLLQREALSQPELCGSSVRARKGADLVCGTDWACSVTARQMANYAFYAVHKGRRPGVYRTWPEAKAQVDQFAGAKYKGFSSQQEAEAFVCFGTGIFVPGPPLELEQQKPKLFSALASFLLLAVSSVCQSLRWVGVRYLTVAGLVRTLELVEPDDARLQVTGWLTTALVVLTVDLALTACSHATLARDRRPVGHVAKHHAEEPSAELLKTPVRIDRTFRRDSPVVFAPCPDPAK